MELGSDEFDVNHFFESSFLSEDSEQRFDQPFLANFEHLNSSPIPSPLPSPVAFSPSAPFTSPLPSPPSPSPQPVTPSPSFSLPFGLPFSFPFPFAPSTSGSPPMTTPTPFYPIPSAPLSNVPQSISASTLPPSISPFSTPPSAFPELVKHNPLDEEYDDLELDYDDPEFLDYIEESKQKGKNKKIKTETGSVHVGKATSVTLTRKQMLEISSDDYEVFIRNVRSVRTLTEEEEAICKEQKRLIKNREAAQQSRAKKKTQIQRLRKEIQQKQYDNFQIEKEMGKKETENEMMKGEIGYLYSMIKQSEVLSASFNAYTDWMKMGGKEVSSFHQSSHRPANNGTFLCLLIFLFCFRSCINLHPVEGKEKIVFPPHFPSSNFDHDVFNFRNLLNSIQTQNYKELEDFIRHLPSPAGPNFSPSVKKEDKVSIKSEKKERPTIKGERTEDTTFGNPLPLPPPNPFAELLRQVVSLAANQSTMNSLTPQNLTRVN